MKWRLIPPSAQSHGYRDSTLWSFTSFWRPNTKFSVRNLDDIMQYFTETRDDYDEQRRTGDSAFCSRGICMCRRLCVSAIYDCALESALFLSGIWPAIAVANPIVLATVLRCLQIPPSPLLDASSLVDQVFLQEGRNVFRTASWWVSCGVILCCCQIVHA